MRGGVRVGVGIGLATDTMHPPHHHHHPQGKDQLLHMIRKYDFNDDTRSSVPTLTTWLYSLKLEEVRWGGVVGGGYRDGQGGVGCY